MPCQGGARQNECLLKAVVRLKRQQSRDPRLVPIASRERLPVHADALQILAFGERPGDDNGGYPDSLLP